MTTTDTRRLGPGGVLALAAAEKEIVCLRAALTELLTFVTSELDHDPGPWSGYFGDPVSAQIAKELEAGRG